MSNTQPLTMPERVQFVVTKRMVAQIDAYRRRQRQQWPGRSEACRQLLEIGLQAEKAARSRRRR